MDIKSSFLNDERFTVSKQDVDRIFQQDIASYNICNIKISKIRKNIKGKIIDLKETDSYKLLNGEITQADYEKYCREQTFGYENHSLESFNNLQRKLINYDLKKGAIVVDQFNIIRDGQHRTCILLKEFGPNYKINVVKVKYKGLKIKMIIKIIYSRLLNLFK